MSAAIPTCEPSQLTIGDTLLFTKSLADYSAADGWTLTYYFVLPNGSGANISFTATASGANFSVNVAATMTLQWPSGDYIGTATVSKSGEVHTVWNGNLTLRPSLAASSNTDLRTQNRKIFDALQAVMLGRAGDDILDSTVEGTVIRRLPPEQLVILLDRYGAAVQREEAAEKLKNGRQSGRNIYARSSVVGPVPALSGQTFIVH